MKTRIAPTPSGYLHLGNAWSFLVTWLAARSRGGVIHLRIDDLDAARFRKEYLEDIFAGLHWLGLDYDTGPRDAADFRARHGQRLRLDAYRSALDLLLPLETPEGPLVYACACSREDVRRAVPAGAAPGIYPGTCRNLALDRDGAGHALRLRTTGFAGQTTSLAGRTAVPAEPTAHSSENPYRHHEVTLCDELSGPLTLHPGRELGDFVLRRKNGDPAYQLASLVDDESLGINLVVRGRDLLPSTGGQLLLARHLGGKGFPHAAFLHHGLITRQGGKLSKSAGSARFPGPASLQVLRRKLGSPDALYRFFALRLGLDPAGKACAADLLPGFASGRVPAGDLPWEEFAREAGLP